MAVLYLGDVTRRDGSLVRSTTAYGNSPEEARDRILERNPLQPGERLQVNHWNGEPVLTVGFGTDLVGEFFGVRDELTVEIPVFRRPRDYSRMRLT